LGNTFLWEGGGFNTEMVHMVSRRLSRIV
jgi:hypothetical protein